MIKHIVLYKLTNPTAEVMAETKAVLLSMVGKVPEIIDIEVGCDILHSDRSYDMSLIVTLESLATMDTYQANPYHCEVVKSHMASVRESAIAIDYEV
ncbi:MAG: Dabb family protein [Bacillota bacterium]